jgi:glutathione S-transferase
MLNFPINASPDSAKAALLLERAGPPCEATPIAIRTGGQFSAEFVALNTNPCIHIS